MKNNYINHKSVLNSIPIPFIVVSSKLIIIYVNNSAGSISLNGTILDTNFSSSSIHHIFNFSVLVFCVFINNIDSN